MQADVLPPSLEEILLRSCGISAITCNSLETPDKPLLPRLRTLNMSQNFLKDIPACMLPSCLVTLDVCNNFLTDLPSNLTSMPDLWNLFVSDNKLSGLPVWMVELAALRRFSFAGNPIYPSAEQRQLAAGTQMSINLRELARKGACC